MSGGELGSGGTVLIQSPSVLGSGSIKADGGSSGGSGGRISIKGVTSEFVFGGDLSVAGGSSSAGSGTIFVQDRVDGSNRGSVYLEGSGSISSPVTSSVTWPDPVQRLILNDDVTVEVLTDVTVSNLGGDGSGESKYRDG